MNQIAVVMHSAPGNQRFTVAGYYNKETGQVQLGLSMQHKMDHFNRQFGRIEATRRAITEPLMTKAIKDRFSGNLDQIMGIVGLASMLNPMLRQGITQDHVVRMITEIETKIFFQDVLEHRYPYTLKLHEKYRAKDQSKKTRSGALPNPGV